MKKKLILSALTITMMANVAGAGMVFANTNTFDLPSQINDVNVSVPEGVEVEDTRVPAPEGVQVEDGDMWERDYISKIHSEAEVTTFLTYEKGIEGNRAFGSVSFNNFEDPSGLVSQYRMIINGEDKGLGEPYFRERTKTQVLNVRIFNGNKNVSSVNGSIQVYAVTKTGGQYLVFSGGAK